MLEVETKPLQAPAELSPLYLSAEFQREPLLSVVKALDERLTYKEIENGSFVITANVASKHYRFDGSKSGNQWCVKLTIGNLEAATECFTNPPRGGSELSFLKDQILNRFAVKYILHQRIRLRETRGPKLVRIHTGDTRGVIPV